MHFAAQRVFRSYQIQDFQGMKPIHIGFISHLIPELTVLLDNNRDPVLLAILGCIEELEPCKERSRCFTTQEFLEQALLGGTELAGYLWLGIDCPRLPGSMHLPVSILTCHRTSDRTGYRGDSRDGGRNRGRDPGSSQARFQSDDSGIRQLCFQSKNLRG
jgi:hypothetical protein